MPPKVPLVQSGATREMAREIVRLKRAREEDAKARDDDARAIAMYRSEASLNKKQIEILEKEVGLYKQQADFQQQRADRAENLLALRTSDARGLHSPSAFSSASPLRSGMAKGTPKSAKAQNSKDELSYESRTAFARLFVFYRQEVVNLRKKLPRGVGLPPKGHPDRPPTINDAREFVKSMNPQWRDIDPSFALQLISDLEKGKIRNAPKKIKKPLDPDATYARILATLEPLQASGALFSIRSSWEVVVSEWPEGNEPPSMSRVFEVMKQAKFRMLSHEGPSGLEEKEKEFRVERYHLEYAYLAVLKKVHPRLIINVDESALRLVPTKQYSWCLEETQVERSLFDRFPLRRNYTTLTAGISKAGKKLRLMANWKGTDRLVIPGHSVLQYAQSTTHWNTTESFLYYLENVVIPFVKAEWESMSEEERNGYSSDFMVVIDCAPIHISLKTREKIATIFDSDHKGHLVFLPPGCTSITQPLDIGCFGPVKSRARAAHLSLLVGALQHRPPADRRKNLANTAETRKMALDAIQTGWDALKESTILHAWERSLGRQEGERDLLDMRLKDRYRRAEDRIKSEMRARSEHAEVLRQHAAEDKKAPRCPEAARWIFRFGLPGSAVIIAQEATEDAIANADNVVQVIASGMAASIATPSIEDEDDEQLPIEVLTIDADGQIADTTFDDSDVDLSEDEPGVSRGINFGE